MIPNRFHFVFGLKRQAEPLHLAHYLCLRSCLEVNRPDAVYFYHDHEPYGYYWELIRPRLTCVRIPRVTFVDAYRYRDRRTARFRYAHASDFVRLEKLLAQGGIYADMDTLFVNPIPRALYAKPFVLGRENDVYDLAARTERPSLCNAFIMSERGAAFGRLWLERMADAFNGTWSNHSTLLPFELSRQHPDWIHLEPPRTFYKFMWSREGIRALLEGLDTDNEGVVSFHLWSHLWWSRRRRDFSDFHGGRLTHEFVRDVDTSYNVVARRFLPPPDKRSVAARAAPRAKRVLAPVPGALREGALKASILARLAVFSLAPTRLVPRAPEHLDYAMRQWKHPEVRTRFRARNEFEQQTIFDDVAMWDTYGVDALSFAPGDVVIDVGAHVGIFSYQCYRRGARNIHSYEAERENFQRLGQFVGGLTGIFPYHLAVFRSDMPVGALRHSGYLGRNTGGGNVLFGGRKLDHDSRTIAGELAEVQFTDTVPLDEILARHDRVRLLKLDCEGSEYCIVMTSRLLERVEMIVGEYHEIDAGLYAALDPAARLPGRSACRAQDLADWLTQSGFAVRLVARSPSLGLFTATRP